MLQDAFQGAILLQSAGVHLICTHLVAHVCCCTMFVLSSCTINATPAPVTIHVSAVRQNPSLCQQHAIHSKAAQATGLTSALKQQFLKALAQPCRRGTLALPSCAMRACMNPLPGSSSISRPLRWRVTLLRMAAMCSNWSSEAGLPALSMNSFKRTALHQGAYDYGLHGSVKKGIGGLAQQFRPPLMQKLLYSAWTAYSSEAPCPALFSESEAQQRCQSHGFVP